MNSKILSKTIKYLKRITVVALAMSMATTLAFAQTDVAASEDKNHKDGIIKEETIKEEIQPKVYEKIIGHGGGTIDGFDTSSSVDALMLAIQNGFKVIELDMELSYDDKIVMLHDWDRTITTYLGRKFDRKLTLTEFNNQLICGKFEPLTFDKLTKILDKNPQVRIVTDTKGDNIKLLATITEKYPKYIDRIIPQIYDYSEFGAVSNMGYKDIIFTLYTQSEIEYDKLLAFVKENDIYAVTLPVDYWVKGLPQKLSKDGVIVYTHPVYTVEEAEEEIRDGAYGVYSSTLIPSELSGYGAEYYLMQTDEDGRSIKLTDATIDEGWIRTIRVHGNMDYKAFKYRLDGNILEEQLPKIQDSPWKKHELSIEIWDINENLPIYTMNYTLTKKDGKVRILEKKYDYRLEPLEELPDFKAVMTENPKTNPTPEILGILSESFIAKAGKYYYYNDGKIGNYSVGNELLSPQKSISGNVVVPLAETIMALGAKDITMDTGRYVYIAMNDIKAVSQVYSNFVRKDTFNKKISEPLSLYRGKAMAGGEFISVTAERSFIDNGDLLIILPQNCTITEKEEEKLMEAATLLYKGEKTSGEEAILNK